jgi:hypothetical protein
MDVVDKGMINVPGRMEREISSYRTAHNLKVTNYL